MVIWTEQGGGRDNAKGWEDGENGKGSEGVKEGDRPDVGGAFKGQTVPFLPPSWSWTGHNRGLCDASFSLPRLSGKA